MQACDRLEPHVATPKKVGSHKSQDRMFKREHTVRFIKMSVFCITIVFCLKTIVILHSFSILILRESRSLATNLECRATSAIPLGKNVILFQNNWISVFSYKSETSFLSHSFLFVFFSVTQVEQSRGIPILRPCFAQNILDSSPLSFGLTRSSISHWLF